MNLTQLKYFKAVCIYKTVSAAAEYLHISQPSLSNAIKEMEKEFGVSLFSRCHRGMVLTAEGKILFKMCDDVLERAEEMEKVMNDLGTERKRLREYIKKHVCVFFLLGNIKLQNKLFGAIV